jgi:branched-chain amino acid transport system ATP-binding protein
VMDRFPGLRERADQRAATLSGGEQQMCAIAGALMALPSLLMLDENPPHRPGGHGRCAAGE